jgi:hypothetical protein
MITIQRTRETQASDERHRSRGLLVRLRHFLAGLAYPAGGEMNPVGGASDADRLGVPPVDWAGITAMRITDGPACIHAFLAMQRRWAAQQAREREVRL